MLKIQSKVSAYWKYSHFSLHDATVDAIFNLIKNEPVRTFFSFQNISRSYRNIFIHASSSIWQVSEFEKYSNSHFANFPIQDIKINGIMNWKINNDIFRLRPFQTNRHNKLKAMLMSRTGTTAKMIFLREFCVEFCDLQNFECYSHENTFSYSKTDQLTINPVIPDFQCSNRK